MSKCHRYYVEKKKLYAKEHILYNSIYTKFKNKKKQSMVAGIKRVVVLRQILREGGITGKEH